MTNDATDRSNFDFWDRLCKLPTYSFLLDGTGSVRRVLMKTGNWIEVHKAQGVMDDAQAEINVLRARLAAVTKKYTVPSEHLTDGSECWCSPDVDYVDPETGVAVIVHRLPS